jgi:hypothetical protein
VLFERAVCLQRHLLLVQWWSVQGLHPVQRMIGRRSRQ